MKPLRNTHSQHAGKSSPFCCSTTVKAAIAFDWIVGHAVDYLDAPRGGPAFILEERLAEV